MLIKKIKKITAISGFCLASLLSYPSVNSEEYNADSELINEHNFWNNDYKVDSCEEKFRFCGSTKIGGVKVNVNMEGKNFYGFNGTIYQAFHVHTKKGGGRHSIMRSGKYRFRPHIDDSKPNLELVSYAIPNQSYLGIGPCEDPKNHKYDLCSIPEDNIMYKNLLSRGFVEDKNYCFGIRQFKTLIKLYSHEGSLLIDCEKRKGNLLRAQYLERKILNQRDIRN